jgi:uncharacterized protein YifN (PemK superfamily)
MSPPDITKVRPVIVLSPKRDNHETCIVVPLSTVEPKLMRSFHHKLECMSLPTGLRDRQSWVKANVVITPFNKLLRPHWAGNAGSCFDFQCDNQEEYILLPDTGL